MTILTSDQKEDKLSGLQRSRERVAFLFLSEEVLSGTEKSQVIISAAAVCWGGVKQSVPQGRGGT